MNLIKTKKNTINGIEYKYLAYDEQMNLICDKCLKPKIVKRFAEYKDANGNIKRICNACYSNVCQNKIK